MAEVASKLNTRQEKFCQVYATDREFFGNGTTSYLEVYDVDHGKPNYINIAAVSASQLLRNPKIIARISELLEDGGFNDANVDKQLNFLVGQHADLKTKLGAIREYNNLKKRITERKEVLFKSMTDEELNKEVAEEVADLI